MPNYDYTCTLCNHVWEETHKIADRKAPETLPCPECKSLGYVEHILMGAPQLGDSVRLGLTRPPGDMREVLQKVHSRSPKSEVANYSNLTRV